MSPLAHLGVVCPTLKTKSPTDLRHATATVLITHTLSTQAAGALKGFKLASLTVTSETSSNKTKSRSYR
jgi:hypothetical protein